MDQLLSLSGPHFPHFLVTMALSEELWVLPAPRCHVGGAWLSPPASRKAPGQPSTRSSNLCCKKLAHRVVGPWGWGMRATLSGQSTGHQGERQGWELR